MNVAADSMHPLGRFRSVLAVCAHPDDESFGLGAVLSTLVDGGATVCVLCLTRGEASTLGMSPGDLADIRTVELAAATAALGVDSLRQCRYADGGLVHVAADELSDEVRQFAAETRPECLVVFDDGGITGHPDHQAATNAARRAALQLGLPLLAWTLPQSVASTLDDEFGAGFIGRAPEDIDVEMLVDRTRQAAAIARHASQSASNPVLWRRLELLGPSESLRWLIRPDADG